MDSVLIKLEKLGKSWSRAGAANFYFNELESIYGLEFVSNPDNGRVTGATMDGEPIAVHKALLLRGKFAMATVWFNTEKFSFHYKNLDPVLANHIIDIIRKQLSEVA